MFFEESDAFVIDFKEFVTLFAERLILPSCLEKLVQRPLVVDVPLQGR